MNHVSFGKGYNNYHSVIKNVLSLKHIRKIFFSFFASKVSIESTRTLRSTESDTFSNPFHEEVDDIIFLVLLYDYDR